MSVQPLTFVNDCNVVMLKLRRSELTIAQAEAAAKGAALAWLYNDAPVVQTYAERLIAEVNNYMAEALVRSVLPGGMQGRKAVSA